MKNQDRMDWILAAIILAVLSFFLLAVPAVTAWGVITGRLNIETLEPVGVEEQIRSETIIQGGFGGY